jgi:hypothetical protein
MFLDVVGFVFVFGDVVAVARVLMVLARVFCGKRWTGEQREKENRRNNLLHGTDGSTSVNHPLERLNARASKGNRHDQPPRKREPTGQALKRQQG